MVPPKNRAGIWYFMYHQERWRLFFSKIWYFFLDGKQKMIFLKKYMETWQLFPASLKKMMLILEKMILPFKINILKRVPMILCIFMDTFLGLFIYCFPMKKPGNLIYRIEIWLYLQSYMVGDILQWRIFNTLYVTSSPQDLYLEVYLNVN